MIALALVLIVSLQETAVPSGGMVAGVLRTETGAPAPRVRVLATPSSADLSNPSAPLAGVVETDETGRFVLNVPPGHYYVLAGRLDRPTAYPGTQQIASATLIDVVPGATISGIDFVLAEPSYPPTPAPSAPAVEVTVPVDVIVEGGAQMPAPAGGRATMIQLIPIAGGKLMEASLSTTSIVLPVTGGPIPEYRVRVDNLPDGYVVKSMTFDATDLTTKTLKAYPSVTLSVTTFGGAGELQGKVDAAMQRAAAGLRRLTITLALKASL